MDYLSLNRDVFSWHE